MADTFEQSWAIKFCTKLDKKDAETHELLKKAYGVCSIVRASFEVGEEVQGRPGRSGR
jgi:hypothetical protein